jgi:hypothetical protein
LRLLSNQIERASVRATLNYRVHPRLSVGVEYDPRADDVTPLLNVIAVTETEKRPAVIFTFSSDRIGTPYGYSYSATVSKDLLTQLGLPIAPYAGVSYGTYEDRLRPIGGLNINFTRWMAGTVMFDGRKVHPMLNFYKGRHGFTFLLAQGKNPGMTYSVSF